MLCHLILTAAPRGRRYDPIFQKKTKSEFVKQLAYNGKPVRQCWGAQPCALGPWSLLRHIMLSHVMLLSLTSGLQVWGLQDGVAQVAAPAWLIMSEQGISTLAPSNLLILITLI